MNEKVVRMFVDVVRMNEKAVRMFVDVVRMIEKVVRMFGKAGILALKY
jgi:hypothetical protein